jgi:hypothetical protein
VEFEQRRVALAAISRAEILGVDAGASHSREVEMKALGERGLEGGRDELGSRVDGAHFRQGAFPILLVVDRLRISTRVSLEVGEGKVDEGQERFLRRRE